jgi:hypothetical protein
MTPEELEAFKAALAESARIQADSNRMQAAQLDMLAKMAKAQGINIDSYAKTKTAYDGLYGATTKQTAAGEANAHGLDVMTQAMAQFDKAAISGTAATFAFGKALLSTEKSFAKYNDVLKNAGDAAWEASKNFGLLGMAGGALIKGVTMAAQAATKQADNTLKATDDLSKMGAAGSFTAKEVLKMGHDAGLTSENLVVFTKATKTLGTATLSLGTTAGEGIEAFSKMTAVSSETRQAFQRLGISQEELIQNQADFVSLQKASGVQITARMKQDGSLQKASLEYTKNLLELAAITGEDVEGAKKLQLEAQSELETKIQTNMMQQRINELQKQGGAQAEAQAAALQKELDARNAVLAVAASTKDAELKSATAQFLATGAITEQSVMLKRLIPNIEEFGEKIKKGQDVSADFAEALQKGTDANARSVGTAGMLDKTVAKTYGLTDGLLTWSAQRRDVDIKAAKDKAGKDIGKPEDGKTGAKTEEDPAQIARNKLTETEIAAKVELDKLLASVNPLINGFDKTTTAATMLAAAAGVAALALTAMAGLSALKDLKGLAGKGKTPGGGAPSAPAPTSPSKPSGMSGAEKEKYDRLRKEGMSASEAKRQAGGFKSLVSAETKITGVPKPVVPPIPVGAATETLAKEAGALSKMSGALGAVSKFAGPVAGAVSVLAGGYTAIQGSKAVDEKVKTGELTKDEGTVKKSEAVGKGVGEAAGGLGGAALGAAIGTAVFPVVGTAIGAALGGWLFAKGGEMVGENVGTAVGRSLTAKPIAVDAKTDASGRANAANDPRTVGTATNPAPVKPTDKTTAANDPKLKNPEAESTGSISKGMADMVKEDAAKRAEAQKKTEQTQEVTFGTLNKTLLATNSALINLTSSITNMSGGAKGPSAGGGGISVPSGVPTSFKTSSKPTSQAPEGAENAGSANKVDSAKIMKFGTGSGSQQNFEGLNSTFKDAVTAAATEYNAVTGNKLTINSAKRDPADQQRLYDETVAAGRPGIGPTGMAVGKPGRSLHEKGEAVDIQNYKDPAAVAALNKQGLSQKVPGDPVHFQALNGGIMEGSQSGYPVEGTMHGREAIVPLDPNSIITKLVDTNESQLKQEMNNNITNNNSSTVDTAEVIMALHEMMAEKFDEMIDILEDGNDHTEKLVRFSAV